MALQVERASQSGKRKELDHRAASARMSLTRRIGATDRMFFTEQLALLIETGENLHGALTTIVAQTENTRMQRVVERLAEDVAEGRSFAHALAQHEQVFSSTYTNLVAASEQGGFMHEVLQQLLVMERKQEELRNTIVSAATYPLFLIVFSLAVVTFVLVVVFPKFGTMFLSIYDQLPATTKALMAVSDVLRQHWIILLATLGILGAVVHRWLASNSGREMIDSWKLRTPGVAGIFIPIYVVQSLQVLSLSLNNGVSVMESLDACRDVVKNSLFRKLIDDVQKKVQDGAGISVGFSAAEFMPPLAKHMIATGERTGSLGKVMARIAEYYEVQLTKKLSALSKLAEPLMLLVMGIVVGVLVSSLILPIFKLSRAVS